MLSDTAILLRGRAAWAHGFSDNPTVNAVFQMAGPNTAVTCLSSRVVQRNVGSVLA
jgi:uncharacterized protein with beta-barrel porin domain